MTQSAATGYFELLSLIERLHRLQLDVVKDELERHGRHDITPVQALLLFNIGDAQVTAGALRSKGYYQGSNISYNLKKLVDLGFMTHQRNEADRRTVSVRLTKSGLEIEALVHNAFAQQHQSLLGLGHLDDDDIAGLSSRLRRLERFWSDRLRYLF